MRRHDGPAAWRQKSRAAVTGCQCTRRRPQEAQDLFQAGLVGEEEFRANAAAALSDPHLLCCLGGVIYRWRRAVPALTARVLYPTIPWERLLAGGVPAADPADAADQASASSQVHGSVASSFVDSVALICADQHTSECLQCYCAM